MKTFLTKHKTFLFYVALATIIFCLHFLLKLHTKDDIYFASFKLSELGNYIKFRYSAWTSRIIIEIVLVFLLKLPDFVWCLLDTLIIMLIIHSISYLFTKNGFKENLIVALVVLCFPFSTMGGAGWYATTLNYLLPLALGLYAFIPIKNALNGKKEKWFKYPIYSICLLFACNQEQMCALVLAFYLIFTVYLIIKNKKVNLFLAIQTILAIASIVFILTCKGNLARKAAEIQTYYPAFAGFNLLEKFILGINAAFSALLINFNLPALILFCTLPFVLRKSNRVVKILSYIPAVIYVYCYSANLLVSHVNHGLNLPLINLMNRYTNYKLAVDKFATSSILMFLFFILFVVLLVFLLYKVGQNHKDNKTSTLFVMIVFLAGLCSKLIMGFSPTVFASGTRTDIFFTFAFIIIICLFIPKIFIKHNHITEENGGY